MYKKYLAGSLLAAALPAYADYVTVISFGGPTRRRSAPPSTNPSSRPPVPAWCTAPTTATWPSCARWCSSATCPGTWSRWKHRSWRAAARKACSNSLDASLLGDAADLPARCRAAVRRRYFRLVHGAGLQRQQAEGGAAGLGRFLGYPALTRQARPALGRQVQPGIRPDGRRRAGQGRVPRAGQRRGPGSRLPKPRPAQAAAAPGGAPRGADPSAR